jgi:L-ribulose-5-phosphate 3-epimerase
MLTRRQMIKGTVAVAGLSVFDINALFAVKDRKFKIGACDWSIGQSASVNAVEVAAKIGLDGVQINMGSVNDDMHLRQKEVQDAYKAAAKKFGIELGGFALGELNNIPYKSDPRAEQWVADSIDVAKVINTPIVLLAFFGNNDLKNDDAGQKVVIERLKKVMPKAEKMGITLGIESWLSAEEHMKIMDAVGSKNLKVYYDVANSTTMGYDIYKEIRWLGKNICEFHAKENGYLIGKGKVNFVEVRKAMDDIGYTGWIQIEGAVPDGADMFKSYLTNNEYMRSIFPESKKA